MGDAIKVSETPSFGEIDTTISHSARIWNYWLGGKDNYAVDREVGDQILTFIPELVHSARADRMFLSRAVRLLAGEAGIRQFLDIGTGLPAVDNTHEVAQRVAPTSRIVYVDNDPLVLVHARALLSSRPEGATDYIHADLHEPEVILRAAARTLDFTRPVGIMLLGVLNFVVDDETACAVVRRLVDAVPSGSYLAISHPTTEVAGEAMSQAVEHWNNSGSAPMCLRTRGRLLRFFEGLELLEPGVVTCSRWRPEVAELAPVKEVPQFGGVAKKP
jgi:S-adenosyl methyltransferase